MSGASRHSDPATSFAAAKSISVSKLEQTLLDLLRSHPEGLTSHEASALAKISLVSISPRFRPLFDKGLIVDSDEKRAGENGRKSIVWKIAPKPPEQGTLF